jgi:hypothetical protein
MISAEPLKHSYYRFFDTLVSLKSNSDRVLLLFKSIYRRFFLTTPSVSDNEKKCEFIILAEEELNKCQAYIGDQIFTTDCQDASYRFLFMLIITSINNEIKSHFMIHAAALSKNKKGIIFPGSPGIGKTTLALSLINHGFKVLTDDLTAYNRKKQCLESSLRSFSVRENTFKLLDFDSSGLTDGNTIIDFGGDKKILIDPEVYHKDCLIPEVTLSYVIFLADVSYTKKKDTGEPTERTLFVTFSNTSSEFIDEIKKLRGVKGISVISNDDFPRVKITIKQQAAIVTSLEALCTKYKILIMNASDKERIRDYENENPELIEIPKSDAVIQLLKNFWNGSSRSALLRQEYKGNISFLYLDLVEVIKNVECYQLTVGKLDKMVEKIQNIIDKK